MHILQSRRVLLPVHYPSYPNGRGLSSVSWSVFTKKIFKISKILYHFGRAVHFSWPKCHKKKPKIGRILPLRRADRGSCVRKGKERLGRVHKGRPPGRGGVLSGQILPAFGGFTGEECPVSLPSGGHRGVTGCGAVPPGHSARPGRPIPPTCARGPCGSPAAPGRWKRNRGPAAFHTAGRIPARREWPRS